MKLKACSEDSIIIKEILQKGKSGADTIGDFCGSGLWGATALVFRA